MLGENHPDYAASVHDLACLYANQGEYARAEPLLRQALEIRKKVLGENHPDYAANVDDLACLYANQGEYARAETLLRQALEIRKKVLGENHPDCAASLRDLGLLYQAQGEYRQAEPLLLQALEVRKKVLGENHPDYARSLNDFARLPKALTPEQEKRLREAAELNHRVCDLWKGGRSHEALPLAQEALKIRQQILGMEHEDTAWSLFNLAAQYHAIGEYAKAEPLYRQALEILKKVPGENHAAFAGTVNNLALLYVAQRDYARAEPLFRQASEIAKKVLGENHPDYAASLSDLARLYEAQGDFARAEPLFRQASEIAKKVLGENHSDYATSLSDRARLYEAQGDFARAEPLFRQASEIAKKVLGENHPDYAAHLNRLAELYITRGDYVRAEPLLRHALEIRKKVLGENHPDYADSLNNLAGLYEAQGDFPRAEPLYREALEIRKKALGENHPDCTASLSGLAHLYWAQADYARAEPLFCQALDIEKKVLGENNPKYATSLNNLAVQYEARGDHSRAEPLFCQALDIEKKVLGENNPGYATSLNNLAGLYEAQHDFARAEPLYRRALEIQKKVLGENHPDYARSLNNLATLFQAQSNAARVGAMFQALETQKKHLGEHHPHYAASLENLTIWCQAQSDFFQALETRKKVRDENHGDYSQDLSNLIDLFHYARAEPLFRQAASLIRRHIEATAVIQSERQQLAMLQDNRFYLDNYLGFAMDSGQYAERAHRELLAWKGMVVRRNRLARAAAQSPELAATFTHLQRVATQLTRLAWAAPDPRQEANWRQRVAGLSAKKERLEAELLARSAEYRQAQRPVPLEDLQRALSEDSVLLDFVEHGDGINQATAERRLLAFVVAPDRPVDMVPLGAARPIDEAIDTWRVTFGMSAEGAKAARLLREQLWAPLEERLHGAKIVLISPDGALSRLPFGALPGKTPGSYLIEERTFAVVPVPQLIPQLVQEEGRKQLRKKLLLLGNVDYDAPVKGRIGLQPVSKDSEGLQRPSRGVPPGTLHFSPLPGTESEIAAIEELSRQEFGPGGASTLRRSQAGKEAFLAEARRHGYLHLATHGFFIEEKVHVPVLGPQAAQRNVRLGHPEPMGLTGGEMFRGPEAGRSYPALLSGLALAGANRAAERQPSPPAPLPEGEGSESPSPAAPLPEGEGSQLPSPPGTVPSMVPLPEGEGNQLPSPPAPLPQGEGSDGILTAEEIGTQNLDGVQIVVLSACESGLGKQASGEGLLGLQRAFQSAGARSVVASLWSVDDAATKTLMLAFYTNLWEKKLPKLEALRQAQLTMLREYDPQAGQLRGPGAVRPVEPGRLAGAKETGGKSLSPFYWASFVLSGDWK